MQNEDGNALIIGILIGLLITGGLFGVYYFGINKSSTHPTTQQTTPTVSTPRPIDQASIKSPTIDLRTYTDPQEKYNFQYPSNATISTRDGMLFTKTPGIQLEPPYQEPYQNFYSFGVSTIPNPNKLDAKTIINNQIDQLQIGCSPPGCGIGAKDLKEYRTGEIDGLMFHFGAETDSVVVVTVRNNTAYVFSMTGDQGYITDYGLKILDQILATFKFSN